MGVNDMQVAIGVIGVAIVVFAVKNGKTIWAFLKGAVHTSDTISESKKGHAEQQEAIKKHSDELHHLAKRLRKVETSVASLGNSNHINQELLNNIQSQLSVIIGLLTGTTDSDFAKKALLEAHHAKLKIEMGVTK